MHGTRIERQKSRAGAVRLVLLLALLLGLCVLYTGRSALRHYARSGFSSEAAFRTIYRLSDAVEHDWRTLIRPALRTLPDERADALRVRTESLLRESWEGMRSGSASELDALLDGSGADAREALAHKLLYISAQFGGAKLPGAVKKAIEAVPAGERPALREALLAAAADDECPAPALAAPAVKGLEGEARTAVLMQLFYAAAGDESRLKADDLSAFKKNVRDKATRADAFRMIARGEVSRADQYVVGHAREVILAGALLSVDALLLALLMSAGRDWRFDFKWLLILAILDFLLLFQLMPLVTMILKAFFPGGSFSLETFRRLYTYPLNLEAIRNTLVAAFATMLLGTLFAFPLAWLVGRTNLYGRRFFRSLFVMTYMVPPYVGAMAWLRLLNPNVGTVNQWLRLLFRLGDAPGPLNVYSVPGLIWVLSTFYYPYAFITISRAMEKMDPSLEEASRISGASPLRTVFTVTMPLLTPSLISGALLVFISAASCYGIPSIIGSPGRVHTVTTRIIEYVSLGQQGMNDAIGMAVFLMAVAMVILVLSDVVLAKKQYITVSGKSVQPTLVDLRRWRLPLTVLLGLFTAVVIVIPFATILLTSFKIDVGKSVLAGGNFTLVNWKTVFRRTETLSCLKNSLVYAAATATVGILVACVMSYLLQRTRVRGRKLPDFLITLGSGTPSVVIALSLIMTMKGSFGIDIYNTAWILIVAYLIKYMMMGMRTVASAMSQIHVSLEECSQISGSSWLGTMLRITGRLIFPSIAAGWFLIFIPSFYELSMTTLLYASTTKTIGFQLYEYWTFTSQPMACAMAFGILLFVAVLNFALGKLTKGAFSI